MIPASSFLTFLVNAAARSLLLAGAVGCGLLALRVRNVVAQKAAWILVLVASLAMPMVARWAAHISWLPDKDTFVLTKAMWPAASARHAAPPPAVSERTFVARQADAETPRAAVVVPPPAHRADLTRFPAPAIAPTVNETAAAAPAAASAPWFQRVRARLTSLSPASTLFLLYLIVAGVLVYRLCFGTWATLRLWWRATPIALDRLTVSNDVQVRSSRAIASPVTVGAGIVLPADYLGWDKEKLSIVLAHEGSHVRQRDFNLQLAASLYVALFWFSPLGWWLKRKLSRLSETISDGAAVHRAASHASYAQVLLEFAALPHPIPIGVAMAHRSHLRSRIEHLLNENSFRQAFSGGRMRLAAAVLLVPVALFGATAMVRVHAAGQQAPPAQAPDSTSAPAQAAPAASQAPNSPAKPPAGKTLAPEGAAAPSTPGDDDLTDGPGASAPGGFAFGNAQDWANDARARALLQAELAKDMAQNKQNFAQSNALLKAEIAKAMALKISLNKQNFFRDGFLWNDGNSYAYVTGEGENGIHYSGNWFDGSRDEIEKARKVAHGDFLWFERDGKSYVIDDPAALAALKPMQQQMDDLGKQQEALGKQQEELGKQQEALGEKMEQARVPTPDVSKEMADLNAAIAKLNEKKGGTVSQEDLADLQGKLAGLEGKLGGIEGQIGQQEGEIGRKQGELGAQQGKLGAEQGRLGAQQGRLAREMDGKALTIIDESMKDGKARPVQ
jgi:beta-lactamase regulating signal transducer with metallopeptidase domain